MDDGQHEPEYTRAFTRLCHFAALTRAGKTDAAVDGLVVAAFAIDPNSCTTDDDLGEALFTLFGIHLAGQEVASSIHRLQVGGRLTRGVRESIRLQDDTLRAYTEATESSRALEAEVRRQWIAGLRSAAVTGPSDEQLWQCLQAYVSRCFNRHGARAIELLGAPLREVVGDDSLEFFLAEAVASTKLGQYAMQIRSATRRFFAFPTDASTRYFSQLLDATFTFFALTVDEATSNFLNSRLPHLKIFVDTNVIFALLGLTEDYFAASAKQVLELARAHRLPLVFYYHERTLRELHDVLDRAAANLQASYWTPALSRAAVAFAESSGSFSSIELTYHRANSAGHVDPDVFLSRFNHADVILQDLGVKVFREAEPSEAQKKQIWELVALYEAFVKQRRPQRQRRYPALDHDIVVSESIRRMSSDSSSVLEAGAILLTNDYLFHRFAWTVLKRGRRLGASVLTTQFLQILRPLVPRTDDFDRRYVQNLALPEFRVSYTQHGQVGRQLLSYLAAYRDLPEETAIAVLTDEVLAMKLAKAKTPERQAALVDSALGVQIAKLAGRTTQLTQDLEAERLASSAEQHVLQGKLDAAGDRIGELERSRGAQAALIADLQLRVQDSSADKPPSSRLAELEARANSAEKRLHRLKVRLALFALVAIAFCGIWTGPEVLTGIPGLHEFSLHPKHAGIQLVVSALVGGLALAAGVDRRHRQAAIAIAGLLLAACVGVAVLL